ncbi:MAG TPA: hypothetical protein VG755_36710 [Nannocystaceae bacterium]|nr:hypothetical protein [Nannocystaceae bacterium]
MTADLRFALPVSRAFTLRLARTLTCGCMRASRSCASDGAVRLCFPLDGSFDVVGVTLRESQDAVLVEATGTRDRETLTRQLARVLGLDHDGDAFARVLASQPELQRLVADDPGARTIVFFSPWVAAGWHVLAGAVGMRRAALVQERLAQRFGDVAPDGLPSFPRPQSVLAHASAPNVSSATWQRLRGIAEHALAGRLDPARLAATPDALAELRALSGFDRNLAEATWIRGCGPADALTTTMPALRRGVQAVYGLPRTPTMKELAAIAEAWRPFRAWVTVLVMREAFRRGVAAAPRRRFDQPKVSRT